MTRLSHAPDSRPSLIPRRWVEVGLAVGSLVLLADAARAWYDAPGVTTMTRGYLIEVVVLGVAVQAALVVDEQRLLWGCLGALTALTVLGAWSIGPSLLPGLLTAGAASVLVTRRTGARPLPAVGWFLAGAVGQTVLMLLVVRPDAVPGPLHGTLS